jgi:hypothetical protein
MGFLPINKKDMNELVENIEQANSNATAAEEKISQQEYEKMYARIKKELMEELINSEDTQSAKTE